LYNEKEIEEQIREMAQLTMISNKINPIQEKNLKMYPMVYFNGVSKMVMYFDLSNGREIEETASKHPGERYVEYHLTVDEKEDNGSFDMRCKHLENSVRNLFFSDTQVYVSFNGKLVFESEKKDVK
jgi:hypothetical protein